MWLLLAIHCNLSFPSLLKLSNFSPFAKNYALMWAYFCFHIQKTENTSKLAPTNSPKHCQLWDEEFTLIFYAHFLNYQKSRLRVEKIKLLYLTIVYSHYQLLCFFKPTNLLKQTNNPLHIRSGKNSIFFVYHSPIHINCYQQWQKVK